MNIIILLRLLFAHILSDFILQTDKICKGKKNNNSSKYGYLSIHCFTHATAAYFLAAQWNNWIIPLVIFATHFIIDYIKSKCKNDNIKSFIVDQLIHLSIIIILWLIFFCDDTIIFTYFKEVFYSPYFWIIITAYIIILKPSSILLNSFINRLKPEEFTNKSIPKAGKWIGYLERVLILTFIFTNNIEGIGFLLAAKSIFRFGQLNKANEIRFTEYVLLGTLASFTVAILIGYSLKWLIKSNILLK
jgi:hypothetical protein